MNDYYKFDQIVPPGEESTVTVLKPNVVYHPSESLNHGEKCDDCDDGNSYFNYDNAYSTVCDSYVKRICDQHLPKPPLQQHSFVCSPNEGCHLVNHPPSQKHGSYASAEACNNHCSKPRPSPTYEKTLDYLLKKKFKGITKQLAPCVAVYFTWGPGRKLLINDKNVRKAVKYCNKQINKKQ